jgi:hypothetical protein
MWTKEQVLKRIDDMERCPEMWAVTKEGFILQLFLLIEIYSESKVDIISIGRELVNSKLNEFLTKEFAENAIKETRNILKRLI